MKVSVIMPVHNCEVFLSAALNSILNQTEKSMELIAINDCSTDFSKEILEYYQKLYPYKMKVINLDENKGVSFARNLGLNLANGKYIYFMDADDVVSYNFLQDFVKYAENFDVGVVIGNFFRIRSYEMLDNQGFYTNRIIKFDRVNFDSRIKDFYSISPAVWDKLFLHDLIGDYKFLEGCIFEDIGFVYPLVLKAKEVVYLYRNDYAYRYTPNSIMENSFSHFFRHADILKVVVNALKHGEKINLSEKDMILLKKVNMCFITKKINRIDEACHVSESDKKEVVKCFKNIAKMIFGIEDMKLSDIVDGSIRFNSDIVNSKISKLQKKLARL